MQRLQRILSTPGAPPVLCAALAAGGLLGLVGASALSPDAPGALTALEAPALVQAPTEEPVAETHAVVERERVEVPETSKVTAEPPTELAATRPSPAAARPRRAARTGPSGAELGALRDKLDGLMQGEPAERLANARAILAEGGGGSLPHRALDVLIELDPKGAAQELRRLAEPQDDPRALRLGGSMIERLGRVEGALSDADLASFYESGTAEVRASAARALDARGDDSLVRAYVAERAEILAGDDGRVRARAARELSMLRSPAAADSLSSLLTDRDEELRLQAVRSIGMDDDADAAEKLRPLLADASERVRRAASRGLERAERR